MTCIYKQIMNNEENKCTLDNKVCIEDECKDMVTDLQQELKSWREELEQDLKEIENGYSTKES